jgi:hypothetical protein
MTNHHQSRLRAAIGGAGLGLLLLMQATTAEAAGPMPADRFDATARVTRMTSTRAVADVLACVAASAQLPSFAHRAMTADGAVIRLRFDGLMFETLAFTATADGGTAVTVALSGAYDRADRAHFQRARGASIAACLITPVQQVAATDAEPGR